MAPIKARKVVTPEVTEHTPPEPNPVIPEPGPTRHSRAATKSTESTTTENEVAERSKSTRKTARGTKAAAPTTPAASPERDAKRDQEAETTKGPRRGGRRRSQSVEVAPVPVPAPAPATTAPAPVAAAPAPAPVPTTPLGIWATEENKGNVRIEECGKNLCGYAVKTGEKILINMRPQETKWTGQIHDPDSGRNYDSTIAMKGSNSLRVQGCAFGGMFCGGQTWKRVS